MSRSDLIYHRASQDGGAIATLSGLTFNYTGGGNYDGNHYWAVVGLFNSSVNGSTPYNLTFGGGQLNCDLFGTQNGSINDYTGGVWTSGVSSPIGYGSAPINHLVSIQSLPSTDGTGLAFSLNSNNQFSALWSSPGLSINGTTCTANGSLYYCTVPANTGLHNTLSVDHYCGSIDFAYRPPTFVNQTQVPTQGGLLTLTGTNYGSSASVVSLSLGPISSIPLMASSIVLANEQAQFLVPAGTGNFSASLTVNQQTTTFYFHYEGPTVEEVTTLGSLLLFNGTNYGADAGKISITVNDQACTNVTLLIPHFLVSCNAPASTKRDEKTTTYVLTVDGQSNSGAFNTTVPLTSSNPPASEALSNPGGKGLSGGAIAGIVIGVLFLLILLVLLVAFFLLRRKKANQEAEEMGAMQGVGRADPATAIQMSLQKE